MPKKHRLDNAHVGRQALPNLKGGHIPRYSGLTDQVFKRLKGDIMALKIPPDSRIMVDSLAKDLGVSQTPVREALSMLEATGLVTKRHFVGYCTAPMFNRVQYEKLFEIRLLLEPYAARQAAMKMTNNVVSELRSLVGKMESEAPDSKHKSYELFADQDTEFHAMIADVCENQFIAQALSGLNTHLHIFRLGVHGAYATDAVAEHARIEKALKEHNADKAEKAMRAHIENSFERLLPFIPN
jgi:DNA-binding GntR family transcriptional regulator